MNAKELREVAGLAIGSLSKAHLAISLKDPAKLRLRSSYTVGQSPDKPGHFISCGTLTVGVNRCDLLIYLDNYTGAGLKYWCGIEAPSKDTIRQLTSYLKAIGRSLGTTLTSTQVHARRPSGGKEIWSFKKPPRDDLWGRVIPEEYEHGEDPEFYLGKFLPQEAPTVVEVADEAASLWRDLANSIWIDEDLDKNISEGQLRYGSSKIRARSAKLLNAATNEYAKEGRLSCFACNFSADVRSEVCVIEFHHTKPIASKDVEGTSERLKAAVLSLTPLCPTCHRIAHKKNRLKPLTVEQIQQARRRAGLPSASTRE
jgi:hypothetical protein